MKIDLIRWKTAVSRFTADFSLALSVKLDNLSERIYPSADRLAAAI